MIIIPELTSVNIYPLFSAVIIVYSLDYSLVAVEILKY